MRAFEKACTLLPLKFRQEAESFGADGVEEIRLRLGRNLSLVVNGTEKELIGERLEMRDMLHVLERATGASVHSAAAALQNGYISWNGLRIGVCGVGVISNGQLTGFRNYSSLAIRLSSEQRGICSGFLNDLCFGGLKNTLIISPPGLGKTTLLRELVRCLSERGMRIGVIDERNELSASVNGEAMYDLGPCSDVLVAVPREQAAMILLRGMNPQIIAMDEISRLEDAGTVEQIVGCGVTLIASAHAQSRADLQLRPVYRKLMEQGSFSRLLTICREGDKRRYILEKLAE